MKTFVELADSNAQIKAYRSKLGLYKDEIQEHMKNISFYRTIARLVTEIRFLVKNKEGNEERLAELRDNLKSAMERWRRV